MSPTVPSAGDTSPEIWLAIAILVLSPAAAHFGWRWLGWWEAPLARLARRRTVAILVSAATPLVLRSFLIPFFPIPEPRVHDEFTFLLSADTFAHGRVANPQHPFWVHFESPHLLIRPAYASAFPMAQGAVLAVGKVLFGHPWFGVWLSAGFMCGAICWMLQGWLPPRWALLGAALAVLRFGVSSYWMNSYWGGCLAAAGGALVLGALPRIMRSPHWRRSLPLGLGLAILANTRPVEGAVFGAAVGGVLFARTLGKSGPPRAVVLRHIVAPLAMILGVAGVGVGYCFARVTGKPWVAPYVLYRESMTMAPHFVWQKPGPQPAYNNRELQNFYVYWEMASYTGARTAPLDGLRRRAATYWQFYLGPLFLIPLLAVAFLIGNRKTRQLLVIAAIFPLALAGQVWHMAHYAAPATGLVILLVIQGMRALYLRPWGRYLVWCLPVACAAMLLIQVLSKTTDEMAQGSWRWPAPGGVARAGILRTVNSAGGRHLLFVRYSPSHDVGNEWVYNDADIDASPVVWARELDPESNAKLMRHFGDRTVWLVEPDQPNPRLQTYRDAPTRPMTFVAIGAPGIGVLRSAQEVQRKVLDSATQRGNAVHTCDEWNYLFTEATGVGAPNATPGCWGEGGRRHAVAFQHWFDWLLTQR
jgi:hypothetical protein